MSELYRVGIYCRLSVDDATNSAKAKSYIPSAAVQIRYAQRMGRDQDLCG